METTTYSHPDQAVRHNYPLANREVGFSAALRLLNRTMPYAVVRFGILLGVSVATIVWAALTVGGAAFLGDKIHPWIGYGWLFAGVGAFGFAWRLVLRYALHLVKCGHIAVLTELITTDQIGNGTQGMFSYGKEVVTKKFGQVNLLFGLDLLIHGVVKAFNRSLDFIAALIPIPGLNSLAALVNAVIHSATTFIDETILSYNLARADENPWRSSQDGILYYCQNAKKILKTAIGVVILDKALTVAAWILCMVPATLIAGALPGPLKGATIVIAALFAWNIRAAFLQPLFLIMIIIKFHVSAENQEINLEWDEKLSSISGKFKQLKDGIESWKAPTAEPQS